MEKIDVSLLIKRIDSLQVDVLQKEAELSALRTSKDEGSQQGKNLHTGNMSTLSREELDAKLQLVEERLDRKVTDIARAVDELKASNVNTVSALNGAKWWAIGTAIAVLAIFLGTLQWGLSAQKEENARFSSYIRDDVKDVADSVKEIAKSVSEMRIKVESQQPEQKR
ncbi:hypothetical protein R6U49_00575 [Pseudomonas aeruginosa]|uniref:hypothetical protein n=1 Tax=Pseudomonas aeruginosa TaxID=287 RepID=UPI0003B1810E|nr:hypothetical protein [Pseudomonas aeruginosa]EKW6219061.1 hypothetical protein [Pseudomonas aeruginosa]ELK2660840.1 hypothetical protein [Pseudomonas aeruginosa]EME0454929.1 hypothetical protein [Pseudomonas aeruginosa]EME7058378.1 hypothetical protein [Pseudomonas aeruginosa]ETD42187.1 hypothetical protein X922_27440 [Pseudomonas aeruginosa VRFPA08]